MKNPLGGRQDRDRARNRGPNGRRELSAARRMVVVMLSTLDEYHMPSLWVR